ncbi:ankyrin repeat protein, partial [Baffinella frigidus]
VSARDLDRGTPLHSAVKASNVEVAKVLLDAGADIEARDKGGRTPLYLATSYGGDEAAVRMLVATGANTEVKDTIPGSGSTPLHIAASRGLEGPARALLEGGADMEATDQSGRTPVDLA